uniref:hypothetical protein n=1 Tax=Klebsiella pneumoniae TaxID=573 RepID=UPI0022B9F332
KFVLKKLEESKDVDLDYGIKSADDLHVITEFLKICTYQLKSQESHLSMFLRYATHGDVRLALEFFKSFITSGYTNIYEVAQN